MSSRTHFFRASQHSLEFDSPLPFKEFSTVLYSTARLRGLCTHSGRTKVSTKAFVLVRGLDRAATAADASRDRRAGSAAATAADMAMLREDRRRGGGKLVRRGSGGARCSPRPEGGADNCGGAGGRGDGTARGVGLLYFEFIVWE